MNNINNKIILNKLVQIDLIYKICLVIRILIEFLILKIAYNKLKIF